MEQVMGATRQAIRIKNLWGSSLSHPHCSTKMKYRMRTSKGDTAEPTTPARARPRNPETPNPGKMSGSMKFLSANCSSIAWAEQNVENTSNVKTIWEILQRKNNRRTVNKKMINKQSGRFPFSTAQPRLRGYESTSHIFRPFCSLWF